ncbi:MAG TPA: hypothetical protein VJS18_06675, partial [Paraburkholderia sp.]|nr:hypothetical protein [Paraburkholderia sp.]
ECEARDETREALRFTRREVRTATRWGDTQLKIHLSRLVELEYVIAHRGRNGLFEYELLYSAEDDGKPHLCGLIDPTALTDDGARSGQDDDQSGSSRAVVGGRSDAAERPKSRTEQGEAADAVGRARSAVNHEGGILSLAAAAQPS